MVNVDQRRIAFQRQSGRKIFQCPFCQKVLSDRQSLYKHKKAVHSDQYRPTAQNTYNVYYVKSTGMCVSVCDEGVYYLLLRKCSRVLLRVC